LQQVRSIDIVVEQPLQQGQSPQEVRAISGTPLLVSLGRSGGSVARRDLPQHDSVVLSTQHACEGAIFWLGSTAPSTGSAKVEQTVRRNARFLTEQRMDGSGGYGGYGDGFVDEDDGRIHDQATRSASTSAQGKPDAAPPQAAATPSGDGGQRAAAAAPVSEQRPPGGGVVEEDSGGEPFNSPPRATTASPAPSGDSMAASRTATTQNTRAHFVVATWA
jgi:hypothetical protein